MSKLPENPLFFLKLCSDLEWSLEAWSRSQGAPAPAKATIQASGDHSAVVPPVPIPNTEVKRCSPNDSASIGCVKVGRRQSYEPAESKDPAGSLFLLGGSEEGRRFRSEAHAG